MNFDEFFAKRKEDDCPTILSKNGISDKKSWRLWMTKNHPDKFNHLSQETIDKQTKLFADVKNCYEKIIEKKY